MKQSNKGTASYPDVSLLMKMCAQRKAGRRQRARRLADLVFKMAARAMADEYAVFKISSALFILRILSKSLPIHVVCMKRKLFSPHKLDSSIIMFTTELHNAYALVICFLRPPPPHPRDIRGLCRAIAGELLQLCDDFMPRPPGTLPQICLT